MDHGSPSSKEELLLMFEPLQECPGEERLAGRPQQRHRGLPQPEGDLRDAGGAVLAAPPLQAGGRGPGVGARHPGDHVPRLLGGVQPRQPPPPLPRLRQGGVRPLQLQQGAPQIQTLRGVTGVRRVLRGSREK